MLVRAELALVPPYMLLQHGIVDCVRTSAASTPHVVMQRDEDAAHGVKSRQHAHSEDIESYRAAGHPFDKACLLAELAAVRQQRDD